MFEHCPDLAVHPAPKGADLHVPLARWPPVLDGDPVSGGVQTPRRVSPSSSMTGYTRASS